MHLSTNKVLRSRGLRLRQLPRCTFYSHCQCLYLGPLMDLYLFLPPAIPADTLALFDNCILIFCSPFILSLSTTESQAWHLSSHGSLGYHGSSSAPPRTLVQVTQSLFKVSLASNTLEAHHSTNIKLPICDLNISSRP